VAPTTQLYGARYSTSGWLSGSDKKSNGAYLGDCVELRQCFLGAPGIIGGKAWMVQKNVMWGICWDG
jgi:hypothetical protein